jgi:hypothetical protein
MQFPATTGIVENRAEPSEAEGALRPAVVQDAVGHKADYFGAAIHDDDKVVEAVGLEQAGVRIPKSALPAVG